MEPQKKYCLLTNDVETTSIANNNLSDAMGERVLKEGLPLLLQLYAEYNIKATFFFTGYIAEKFPEVVRMVLPYGHEVGSHGYSHKVDKAFDVLSFEEQVEHLRKSKSILEDISGQDVISFRAPAARVNRDTAIALKQVGFKVDSSVASQRFDMFLSFGGMKKLKWLVAPRKPYFTHEQNLMKRGSGDVFEIPISALIMPYIGTTMRIFPFTTRQLRKLLSWESSINSKPIVFLTHPNEFIDEISDGKKIVRRSSNYISYLLGDVIRRELKLKNLGLKAIPLYRKEIEYFNSNGFKFVTCKQYYENQINKEI
ncbi:MAG: polysaccharide deacetylase family protein [Bacteroidales bacterium]|nr:polysaccharide deacetylase family protein [Bacteroidales bacterium]